MPGFLHSECRYLCTEFCLFVCGDLISVLLNAGLDAHLGSVSRPCVAFTGGIDYGEHLCTDSDCVSKNSTE